MMYKPDAYATVTLKTGVLVMDAMAGNGRRLAIDFEVSSNRSNNPNQAVCQIYGLNETNRQAISSEGVAISIYAGYEGVHKLIFQGDITTVQVIKLNPGWAVKITAGDGIKPFTESVVTKTYASGTEKSDIVKDVIDSMKLAAKTAVDTITGKTDGDLSLDGLAKDALSTVVGDAGASWSIQDGEVHIAKIDEPIDNEAIVISSDTGLLESPIVTEKGLNIRAVLNPDVRPGKLISLKSATVQIDSTPESIAIPKLASYDGFYLVQSVSFVGNNYGGAFDVVMETASYDK